MDSKEVWEGKTLNIPNSWLIVLVVVLMGTSFGIGFRQRFNLPGVNLDEELGLDLTGDAPDDGFGEGPSGTDYVRNTLTIDFEIDQKDWQSGAGATPTNPVYAYFYEMPQDDEAGIGITVAGEDITIRAENDGMIWIDVYAGTDFFIVERALRQSNPVIKNVVINDYDNDDQLDFLVQLDLSDYLREDFQYKPTYVMEMPILDVDASWTMSSPSDQGSVGTGSGTTVTISWVMSGVTADDGAVISDIVVKTNDTEKGNDVTLKDMTISGTMTVLDSTGRTLSGSSLTLSPTTTYIGGSYAAYYTQSADDDEPLDSNALMIYRDTNAGDILYMTVNVICDFEAEDDVTVDLEFTVTSPDGTTASVTDSVKLSDA